MRKVLLYVLLVIFTLTMAGCYRQAQGNDTDGQTRKSTYGIPSSEPLQEGGGCGEADDSEPSEPEEEFVWEADLSFEANLSKLSSRNLNSFLEQSKNDLYSSLYEIDGIKFGRIVSSAESAEDAVDICTRRFTSSNERYPQSSNRVTECYIAYESDLFYGVYVKCEHYYYEEFDSSWEEILISFKKDVADITARNSADGVEAAYRVCVDQEELVEQIVLYLYYNDNSLNEILDYEMLCDDNEYRIIVYAYDITYGDWGVSDEYSFEKQEIVVDRTSGVVAFQEPIELITVYKESAYS